MKRLQDYIVEEQSVKEINGFAILKPGFLHHKDQFIDMLNNNGWKIVQKSVKQLKDNEAKELYKSLEKKDFYKDLCNYMCSDKCMCCSCYKDCKNPIEDMKKLKDKVRDAWGKDEMRNAMHSSDSIPNVNRENKLCLLNCGVVEI